MSFYKKVPGRQTTLESTLKFDTEPREGSTNPVTSEGVKGAIDGAVGDAAEALQEQIDEIAEKAGSGYTPKGEATVATLNALSGQDNGELYTMTDAGTLTDGSLAVVAGDTVAWDATNEVWYKAMDYVPRQYGTNEIKNLPTTATEADLAAGNYFVLDGTNTKKLPADDVAKSSVQDNLVARNNYVDANIGVFTNKFSMRPTGNYFSFAYCEDYGVKSTYNGTEATIYMLWNESMKGKVDINIVDPSVTLKNISVSPNEGDPYSIKNTMIIPANADVNVVNITFQSTSNFSGLGKFAYIVAGDANLVSPLDAVNLIGKVSKNESDISEIKEKMLPNLVLSEGRIYDNCTFTNVSYCAFSSGVKHYFGKNSKKVRMDAWARFTITNFTHKAGERCGVMIWIDPSIVKMDYQNESAVGQKIASFDVLFKSNGTTVQTINMVYYDLNNGWNFVQSDALNSVIDTIQITAYANLSSDRIFLSVDSVVCGRLTKPVLAVSYDGIYSSTDTIGVYDYHDSQNIPATILGAEQYGANESYVAKVKTLHERGIFEIGSYGSAAQKATYDESVTQAQLPKKTMNSQKLDATDVISVGCAHGACCTTVENLYTREGFKVFRALTCFGQNVMDDVNGLRKCPSIGVTINSESWDADKDAALVSATKSKIDKLIANGDWAALVTHQIVNRADVTAGDVGLACTWEAWQEILDYVKTKETAGELTIMTIGDLWKNCSYSEVR